MNELIKAKLFNYVETSNVFGGGLGSDMTETKYTTSIYIPDKNIIVSLLCDLGYSSERWSIIKERMIIGAVSERVMVERGEAAERVYHKLEEAGMEGKKIEVDYSPEEEVLFDFKEQCGACEKCNGIFRHKEEISALFRIKFQERSLDPNPNGIGIFP